MRTFGELQVDEIFVLILERNTDESVYLFRKTQTGMAYFGGIRDGELQWVEERGGLSDTQMVQPVALEKPDKFLLQLFS